MMLSTIPQSIFGQRAMSAAYPMSADFTDSTVLSMPPDEPGSHGQRLSESDWAAVLEHLAQLQRRQQDYPFQFSLVRLVSWPSLIWVPQDVQPALARVCALLARKPSAASLLPLLLELPEAQVFVLIEALRLYGHVQLSGIAAGPQMGASAFEPLAAAGAQESPALPSLITKIWQRLLSRN